MAVEIGIGTLLLIFNITFAAVAAMLLEVVFVRVHPWLLAPPHRPKLVFLVATVSLWVLGVVTAGVWIWASAYLFLGIFETLEEAVYFSLVCFTTLGLGDIVMPKGWRILSGMEAANGFLNFGLLCALMIEALRQIRLSQVESRRKAG
ncbi:potassium channel family protein [Tabrizicola sp. J26]|uniref:ion channel n=1 Tax=Alitabrizicola rongguiensis TaxID=2909234 RepID=UPI001F186B9C|nr:ion channel [Tabrizicola rongguiensis]MCF1707733.1 potassium channel family protein [Tabrizicola rongguiensis]